MADFIIDLKIWPHRPLKNSKRLSKVSDWCLLFRRGVFIVNQWFLVKSRKSKGYITTNYQHDQVQNAPLELFDQVHDPPPQGGLWAVLGHNHCHGGRLVSHFVAGNHHDHHRNHHHHHHNSLNDQAIQWMRNPTPQSKLKSFEPFNCNYGHRPPRCSSPKVTIRLLFYITSTSMLVRDMLYMQFIVQSFLLAFQGKSRNCSNWWLNGNAREKHMKTFISKRKVNCLLIWWVETLVKATSSAIHQQPQRGFQHRSTLVDGNLGIALLWPKGILVSSREGEEGVWLSQSSPLTPGLAFQRSARLKKHLPNISADSTSDYIKFCLFHHHTLLSNLTPMHRRIVPAPQILNKLCVRFTLGKQINIWAQLLSLNRCNCSKEQIT